MFDAEIFLFPQSGGSQRHLAAADYRMDRSGNV
jgi:hypothetical protein